MPTRPIKRWSIPSSGFRIRSVESMKRLHQLLTQINPKVADVRVETVIDNSFINKLESSGFIQSVYKKN